MQCRPIETARESKLYQREPKQLLWLKSSLKYSLAVVVMSLLFRMELAKLPKGNELHTFHEFQSQWDGIVISKFCEKLQARSDGSRGKEMKNLTFT